MVALHNHADCDRNPRYSPRFQIKGVPELEDAFDFSTAVSIFGYYLIAHVIALRIAIVSSSF